MVNKDIFNQSLFDTINAMNKYYENNITTSTGHKVTYETKIDDIDEVDWCDYPYLGIGRKPISNKKQTPTCEQLEKIIAG